MRIFIPSSSQSEVSGFLQNLEASLRNYVRLDKESPAGAKSFEAMADRIGEQVDRYEEPFRLVVAGEFNAGKSSVINALVGEREFVLSGVTPTTGAITEIWYSEEDRGQVWVGRELVASGTREEIAPYADQRTEQGRQIAHRGARILLTSDAEVLRNLVIIDTPGLGANVHDDETTKKYLDLADAAIVVVSGLQPGGDATQRLAEWLYVNHRRVMAVVTKVDALSDPKEALDAVDRLLADTMERKALAVVPPAILDDLEALESAATDEDEAQAQAQLVEHGYTDLVANLQDSLLLGDSADRRRTRVLSTAHRTIGELLAMSERESAGLDAEVNAVSDQLSEAQRTIHDVLRPKIPYIDSKADQIAMAEISEYIDDLSEAANHFLEEVNSKSMGVGFRYLKNLATGRKEQFGVELQKEFEELFPPSQLEITLSNIDRAITNLLQAEWEAAAVDVKEKQGLDSFKAGAIANEIAQQLAKVAASAAATAVAAVMLFFVPGGQLFELAALLFTGFKTLTGRSQKKSSDRLSLMKTKMRVKLRAQRRKFAHDVAQHYRTANRDIANRLIGEIETANADQETEHRQLLELLEAWNQASEDLERWQESAEALNTGGRYE